MQANTLFIPFNIVYCNLSLVHSTKYLLRPQFIKHDQLVYLWMIHHVDKSLYYKETLLHLWSFSKDTIRRRDQRGIRPVRTSSFLAGRTTFTWHFLPPTFPLGFMNPSRLLTVAFLLSSRQSGGRRMERESQDESERDGGTVSAALVLLA